MSQQHARRRDRWLGLFLAVAGVAVAAFILPFGVGVRAFRMPSGSMQPAISAGDHFVITKWTYGYGRYSFAPFPSPIQTGRFLGRAPRRGELAVFRPQSEPDRDFVKRVVGLPGDRIQMIDGALHINGAAVERVEIGEVEFQDDMGSLVQALAHRETLPGGASYVTLDRVQHGELDNTHVFVVPADAYFVMGDDRDNSADSRVPSVVGYVPIQNFVGRVAWVLPSSPEQPLE